MKRNVSPAFAVVVIVIALVVGALYFASRYRASEALVAKQKAGTAARYRAAQESGRVAQQEQQMATRRAARTAAESEAAEGAGKKSAPTGK